MKRLWISACLILILAIFASCHVLYLSRFTHDLEELLTQAQEQVEAENWAQAESLTRQALAQWEEHAFYLHSTLRHDDIDSILACFHEVLAFLAGQERQPAEYAAANARLLTQISLLLEAELPSPKNIL